MRIRVIPYELHSLAALLGQAAQMLEEVSLQVQRAWSGLDWEIHQEASLEILVIQARRQALILQEEARRMARFLSERATAFEQADQEGNALLGQVTGTWIAAVGGLAALRAIPVLSFPANRAQGYLRLGGFIGSPSPRWNLLRVEPDERRALVDFGVDWLLSRIKPLEQIQDILDITRVSPWQQKVDEAFRAWEEARQRFGVNSLPAQEAYGRYLERLIFEMPFFGKPAQALLALLKIAGRMHPVE